MPTIKKISLNGASYDLGGGLTEDVKQASLQIAEKVAYIDEHGQDYYDELYTAFYDNMWNVTNTLSNAVTSNPAVKTPKDGTYTAIISAATGYTLEGATVSVTMNGANITSSVYNNGTISIPSVTGDVVITVVAVALTVVSISAVYTQSGTVYDTDTLDSLKADLVVTATYSDSSTAVVPAADYTLSGALAEGTSTITVTYGGKTDTFNVTVSFTVYSLSTNLTKLIGSTNWTSGHGAGIEYFDNNANRRSFYLTNGVTPVWDGNNNVDTIYYPIPIPPTATKVTISITPNTQFHGEAFYTYSGGAYTRQSDPGWKQGEFTHTITAGEYAYLTTTSKYNSAGTSYPTEPTELTITFAK